jgi:hypothetical protein
MSRPKKNHGSLELTDQDDFEALLAGSSLGTEAARQIASLVPISVKATLAAHVTRPVFEDTDSSPEDAERTRTQRQSEASFLANVVTAALTGASLHEQTDDTQASGSTAEAAVIAQIKLRLRLSRKSTLPVPAEFRYYPNDPFAVHVEFHTGKNEAVQWSFARGLLSNGLNRPTGDGDVHIGPHQGKKNNGTIIRIKLSSPEGEALLEAPRLQLAEFLRQTKRIVPTGKESALLDFDSFTDFLQACDDDEEE